MALHCSRRKSVWEDGISFSRMGKNAATELIRRVECPAVSGVAVLCKTRSNVKTKVDFGMELKYLGFFKNEKYTVVQKNTYTSTVVKFGA